MSMYQFNSYLNDIPEIEKMFYGGKSDGKPDNKSSKQKLLSNKELVVRARNKGFMAPKHY